MEINAKEPYDRKIDANMGSVSCETAAPQALRRTTSRVHDKVGDNVHYHALFRPASPQKISRSLVRDGDYLVQVVYCPMAFPDSAAFAGTNWNRLTSGKSKVTEALGTCESQ